MPALILAPILFLYFLLPMQTVEACEFDRTVVFAGLDWQSNAFHTAVARRILEYGYGCKTDVIPGSTIPLLQGVAQGDIDVVMEVWKDNVTEVWKRALSRHQVVEVGINFEDAVQGWFVPRYLVEGEGALAPELNSVFDLPRYKKLFSDPEEPDKGRFYNCVAGWTCEVVNTAKLNAYKLYTDFTNFRPGTGAALAAAIASANIRRKPILAYYWGPTWILGKFDLVMLEEPPFDPNTFRMLTIDPDPQQATAYPIVPVVVGANSKFAAASQEIVAFLASYKTNGALVSDVLAYMEDKSASADEAARWFLLNHYDVWSSWVPADKLSQIKAELN